MLLGLNGGLVGLIMTYAISLMGLFQWGVRQSAEVENLVRRSTVTVLMIYNCTVTLYSQLDVINEYTISAPTTHIIMSESATPCKREKVDYNK